MVVVGDVTVLARGGQRELFGLRSPITRARPAPTTATAETDGHSGAGDADPEFELAIRTMEQELICLMRVRSYSTPVERVRYRQSSIR